MFFKYWILKEENICAEYLTKSTARKTFQRFQNKRF